MKFYALPVFLIVTSSLHSQPRAWYDTNQRQQQVYAQALVQYVQQLGRNGQPAGTTPLMQPQLTEEQQREQKNAAEQAAFANAAYGILTGAANMIAGASTNNPAQVANGICTMFGAALQAASRSDVPFSDRELDQPSKRAPRKSGIARLPLPKNPVIRAPRKS